MWMQVVLRLGLEGDVAAKGRLSKSNYCPRIYGNQGTWSTQTVDTFVHIMAQEYTN